MSDDLTDAAGWFQDRGFDLSVTQDDETWWATLIPVGDPAAAVARYGRGDTPEAAAVRARKRYEQEQ